MANQVKRLSVLTFLVTLSFLWTAHRPCVAYEINAVHNNQSINTIDSFDDISFELNAAADDTLIIFDVDDVLITYEDMVLRPCGAKFRPSSWNDIDPNEILDLVSIMLSESRVILIEPSTTNLIEMLQNKGVKTIALTAARTGKFGVIENAENWRLEVLKKLNVDFSCSFPTTKVIDFDNDSQKKSDYSLFKEGVLFQADERGSKGALLIQFLETIKWKPKEVIFIDDKLSQLNSVKVALNEAGIPFKGYQYNGVNMLPGKFNEEIAEIQFSRLRKDRIWLSDSEAELCVAREDKISRAKENINLLAWQSLQDDLTSYCMRRYH